MQIKMLVLPIALFAIKCAVANVVTNSFIIAQGNGVSVSQDGNIILDKSAFGDIEVTARSGWLVNGRKSILIDTSSKIRLKVTSQLGEDEEYVPSPINIEKVKLQALGAQQSRYSQGWSAHSRNKGDTDS